MPLLGHTRDIRFRDLVGKGVERFDYVARRYQVQIVHGCGEPNFCVGRYGFAYDPARGSKELFIVGKFLRTPFCLPFFLFRQVYRACGSNYGCDGGDDSGPHQSIFIELLAGTRENRGGIMPRAPSVAAKPRLVARFVALADLGGVRISLADASRACDGGR